MSGDAPDPLSDDYLEKHKIHLYIEDAINQLLEYKDEHPKVIPSKFLADYFRSVHNGAHTLYREYSFISKTPHNRSCFIKNVWSCFRKIASHGELLGVKEYHSLLKLICRDFPLEMVQRSARIVLIDDALDCLMSFIDFLYAFQIQFYFEDYINQCKEPYDQLLTGSATVFVPSTDDWQPGSNPVDAADKHSEGVSSHAFFDALEKVDLKMPSLTPRPNLQHVRGELDKTTRITLHGLLMALSKNELVNSEIGVLPHRDEVLSGSDIPVGR